MGKFKRARAIRRYKDRKDKKFVEKKMDLINGLLRKMVADEEVTIRPALEPCKTCQGTGVQAYLEPTRVAAPQVELAKKQIWEEENPEEAAAQRTNEEAQEETEE